MAGHVITNYLRSQTENCQVISVARSKGIITPDVILDVTEFEKLSALIKNERPDFIVNAIGLLNEVAEKNPDLAILINSYLPHFLESVTRNTACKIIHISTDCVFSGKKGGDVETDFKEMVLIQNKIGGVRFEGKGYVRQSENRLLNFRLYASKQETIQASYSAHENQDSTPRKLILEDRYYDLILVGYDDRKWKAHHVFPNIDLNLSDNDILVSGKLDNLSMDMPYNYPESYLKIHFFSCYEIPLNRMTTTEIQGNKNMVLDTAEFEASEANFKVRSYDDDTIFEVRSQVSFPEAFHLRVQEALQYLTGKSVNWQAYIKVEKNNFCMELSIPFQKSIRTYFEPPIIGGSKVLALIVLVVGIA